MDKFNKKDLVVIEVGEYEGELASVQRFSERDDSYVVYIMSKGMDRKYKESELRLSDVQYSN